MRDCWRRYLILIGEERGDGEMLDQGRGIRLSSREFL